jgi:hypothetical protein
MRDRSQPSAAPADFRVANLQAVRGSNSKADVSSPNPGDQEYGRSFKENKRSQLGLHYQETVGCGVAVCLTSYSVNAAHADNSSA